MIPFTTVATAPGPRQTQMVKNHAAATQIRVRSRINPAQRQFLKRDFRERGSIRNHALSLWRISKMEGYVGINPNTRAGRTWSMAEFARRRDV
jgi:hypothetical protein